MGMDNEHSPSIDSKYIAITTIHPTMFLSSCILPKFFVGQKYGRNMSKSDELRKARVYYRYTNSILQTIASIKEMP